MSNLPKILKDFSSLKGGTPIDLPKKLSQDCETAVDLASLERQIARRRVAVVFDSELRLKIMAKARG